MKENGELEWWSNGVMKGTMNKRRDILDQYSNTPIL